ncbi:MAG: SpoIVB peptidase [Clostridiales bacterium]|nr:SpoIVB peptidase [Clostridiales bacterium]
MKKFIKILSVALSFILILGSSAFSLEASEAVKSVYLGGESFGVKFYANGVIVTQLENYYNGSKYVCPAQSGRIKVNDIIKEVDGNKITSNEKLQSLILGCSGKELVFTIERDGKKLSKKVTPIKNTAGSYLLGIWVRDSCAGIGTITYYDSESSYFAALGHGMCDSETLTLMPLAKGEVLKAEISGVTKSTAGSAGSLNGYFTDTQIGFLTQNTDIGVYGTINDNSYQKKTKIEIADADEIKVGKAEIYTTVYGDRVGCYDIEISKICNDSASSNENFVIKITNDELLEKCSGIVQGMSGSPIVQNGKLVGAVTHVFLNNPDEGYGISAQNMVLNYEG